MRSSFDALGLVFVFAPCARGWAFLWILSTTRDVVLDLRFLPPTRGSSVPIMFEPDLFGAFCQGGAPIYNYE